MKIKRPSLKDMKNCEYLGHFAQDKYIQQGHNDSKWPGDKMEKGKGLEGGGGPGGSASMGRPSGARNIKTLTPSELEIAEGKKISNSLTDDLLRKQRSEILKRYYDGSPAERIKASEDYRSLSKKIKENEDEWYRNALDASRKRK